MRKVWKRIGLALAILIILFLASLLVEHLRGAAQVAACKRELAVKGETLSIDKLAATPPLDGGNGLPEVLNLEKGLLKGNVIPESFPPRMRIQSSGKAEIGFIQDSWVELKTTNEWRDVESDLASNAQVLAKLRDALREPWFSAGINYSNGFDAVFEHLIKAKRLSQWFGTATQNSIRQGNSEEAINNLVAALATVRLVENDRLAISELVRIAISSVNFATTWEALQTNLWSDQQLARLHAAWATNTFVDDMFRALEMERAVGDTYYARFRQSNDETYKSIFPSWREELGLDDERAESTS